MKKIMTNIRTLAALLIASATFAACSSDDNTIDLQPAQPAGQQVYTMTIQATKSTGDEANARVATRALALGGEDNKTLNATWATTENIFVKKGSDWATGSLQPDANAATATLKGTLNDITIAASDELTLQFPRSGELDYTGQVGTLEDIAAKYDYATATVTVASVSATGNINPTAATTSFTNQQAIVKFTLVDKADGTTPLNATELIVSDGTNTYTVTPASATSEIYVAIPGFSGKTITLTATVGSDTYTLTTSSAKTFANGSYYRITAQMTKQVTTASTLSELKTAINSGTDCSSYLGWQVNSDGDIAESNVSGTLIGYVGYVSTSNVDTGVSGSRILVLASADASTGAQWGSHGTSRGLSTDGMTGYSYTNTLQGKGSDDSNGHPAAYAAWNYNVTIPSGGATPAHWFLPTQAQLTDIVSALGGYLTFKTKVGLSSANYWSSTEDGSSFAWSLGSNGNWNYNYKSSLYYVRSCFAY